MLELLFDRFFELFVPWSCLSCHRESRGLVCPSCLSQIKKIIVQTDDIFSYGPYEGILKDLISQFKYSQKPGLSKPLAELLSQMVVHDVNGIIPVPLHKNKLKQRRYNQAALLAEELSKRFQIPSFPNGLIKERDTISQTHLSKSARQKNVRGVFKMNPKYNLEGDSILLVDDVCTTGATLKECQKLLFKHGVKDVYPVTVAKQFLD